MVSPAKAATIAVEQKAAEHVGNCRNRLGYPFKVVGSYVAGGSCFGEHCGVEFAAWILALTGRVCCASLAVWAVLGYEAISIPGSLAQIVHMGVAGCVAPARATALSIVRRILMQESCADLRKQCCVYHTPRYRGLRLLRVDIEAGQVLRAD